MLRTIDAGEVGAFVASLAVPFLDAGDEAEEAEYRPHIEPERAWVVVDGDRLVASACTLSRDVTVPAPAGGECPTVPFAAVSGVGVHPTHRRRGLLRRLMAAMFDDARRRGEAFAALQASESSIYGRFGYGQGTTLATTVIDTARSAFVANPPPLDVQLLESGEAAKVLPGLHDRLRRGRAGEVSRNEPTWAGILADPPAHRKGGSALYYAAGDDAYAIYRAHEISAGGLYGARLEVRDLYGATPEVEAALWRFLFDVDLVREVSARARPVDDHLRWRLADPRQLRVTSLQDLLWVRILDVAAAFEARGYQHEGRLVLDVHGDDAAVAGRWVLDVGRDGSSCRRAGGGEAADVSLGIPELGSLYLGGVGASTLAAAGRAAEDRSGGLRAADHILAATPAPFSGTGF